MVCNEKIPAMNILIRRLRALRKWQGISLAALSVRCTSYYVVNNHANVGVYITVRTILWRAIVNK